MQFKLSSKSSQFSVDVDTVGVVAVDSVEDPALTFASAVVALVVVLLWKGQRDDPLKQARVRKKPSDSRALLITRSATIDR